jgi:hypothetical protein
MYSGGGGTITMPNPGPATTQGRSIVLVEVAGNTTTTNINSSFGNFWNGTANDPASQAYELRVYVAGKDSFGDPGWVRAVFPEFATLDTAQTFSGVKTFLAVFGITLVAGGNMGVTGDPKGAALLRSTTAATVGSQSQHSPSLRFEGQAWNGAASVTRLWDIRMAVTPSGSPTSAIELWSSDDGGATWIRRYALDEAALVLMQSLRVDGNVGFFATTPIAQQVSGGDLTNNVTAGGTTDQLDNFTDLTVYANDAAAIRNDIYQLARKLKQVNDALRDYGLLT